MKCSDAQSVVGFADRVIQIGCSGKVCMENPEQLNTVAAVTSLNIQLAVRKALSRSSLTSL